MRVQIFYSTPFSSPFSINTFCTTLIPLLAPICSAVVVFVSTYQLMLRFYNFFLMLEVDPRRRLNYPKALKYIILKITYILYTI